MTYTGTGTKDGNVTITFTYTGTTTSSGYAAVYYGLYIAKPGEVPDQGNGKTNGANAVVQVARCRRPSTSAVRVQPRSSSLPARSSPARSAA